MKKTSSGRSGGKYTTSSEFAGIVFTASYIGSPATQCTLTESLAHRLYVLFNVFLTSSTTNHALYLYIVLWYSSSANKWPTIECFRSSCQNNPQKCKIGFECLCKIVEYFLLEKRSYKVYNNTPFTSQDLIWYISCNRWEDRFRIVSYLKRFMEIFIALLNNILSINSIR